MLILRSKNMIPCNNQFLIQDNIGAVVENLQSDYLTTGSKVKEFEGVIASYCVAVANGIYCFLKKT